VAVVNQSMLATKKKDHSDGEGKESNPENENSMAIVPVPRLKEIRNGEGGKKKVSSTPDFRKEEKEKEKEKEKKSGMTGLFSTLSLSPLLTTNSKSKTKEEKEKEEKEKEKKEREKREKEEREKKEKEDKKEKEEKEKKEKEEMDLITSKLKKHPVFNNVDPMVAATVDGMMNEYFTPQKLRKINGEYAIKAKLQFVAMSMFSFKKLKYAPSIVLSTISEAVSEFRLVHSALQIGPYRLDWNRAEISLPKEIRCDSEPLMLLDLKGIYYYFILLFRFYN